LKVEFRSRNLTWNTNVDIAIKPLKPCTYVHTVTLYIQKFYVLPTEYDLCLLRISEQTAVIYLQSIN